MICFILTIWGHNFMKNTRVTIKISDDMYNELKEIAENDDRSMSSAIRLAIIEFLAKREQKIEKP